MKEILKKIDEDYLSKIYNKYSELAFKKIELDKKDLYIVFSINVFSMKDIVGSSTVEPLALIYSEDDEYIYYPLNEEAEYEDIIKEFVEYYF